MTAPDPVTPPTDNGWRCEFCTIEAQRECNDSVCRALMTPPTEDRAERRMSMIDALNVERDENGSPLHGASCDEEQCRCPDDAFWGRLLGDQDPCAPGKDWAAAAFTEGPQLMSEDNLTPSATDALRRWVFHAGFGLARRSAALDALDAFDAALCGDTDPSPAPGVPAPVEPPAVSAAVEASAGEANQSPTEDRAPAAMDRPAYELVRLLTTLLNDADQVIDSPERPNGISIWAVRAVMEDFGGKPHRWTPKRCEDCNHPFSLHYDWCSLCACMLSRDEALNGRDEDLDESIEQALREDS